VYVRIQLSTIRPQGRRRPKTSKGSTLDEIGNGSRFFGILRDFAGQSGTRQKPLKLPKTRDLLLFPPRSWNPPFLLPKLDVSKARFLSVQIPAIIAMVAVLKLQRLHFLWDQTGNSGTFWDRQ
jgi:hypothetical protein